QERDARVGIGDEVARVSKPRVEELLDQQLARTLASVRYGRGCWRTAFDSCWSTSSPGPRSSSCGAITGGIRSSTLLLFASACSSESSRRGLSLSMPSRAARPVPSRSDADAGEAESPRKQRAEYEAAGGGREDERDDLETGADRVAQGQPGLRDAEAEHDDDGYGDRRRHSGDEHRVLVACRGRHGDHDREDARDPVLRTEDRLANFAEEVGFAAFLAQMRSQPRLAVVVVRLGRPLRHRHEGTSRT